MRHWCWRGDSFRRHRVDRSKRLQVIDKRRVMFGKRRVRLGHEASKMMLRIPSVIARECVLDMLCNGEYTHNRAYGQQVRSLSYSLPHILTMMVGHGDSESLTVVVGGRRESSEKHPLRRKAAPGGPKLVCKTKQLLTNSFG